NRPCGSCRTSAGERGRGTRARAWFEATGPGLRLLNSVSADHDLVTAIEVDVLGGAGGQLQDAVGAPHEPHHPPPLRQVAIDLSHALAAVEEDSVDGESHEHHVDAVAGTHPQAPP